MPEITVEFKNALNGYNKQEVDRFLKEEIEPRLQQRSQEITELRRRVVELETKLKKLTGGDETVERKVELYEKLMKKMDGDYENLLAPAIAKAKAIEEKAEKEYRVRIDQAKYAAEGIYAEVADRIVALLEGKIADLYLLIEKRIRANRLSARVAAAFRACGKATKKIAGMIVSRNGQKAPEKTTRTGKQAPKKRCCCCRKKQKKANRAHT